MTRPTTLARLTLAVTATALFAGPAAAATASTAAPMTARTARNVQFEGAAAPAAPAAPRAGVQLVGGTPPPTAGAAGALYGLRPAAAGKTKLSHGHFAFALPSGAHVKDGVDIENLSPGPLTINLYPADVSTLPTGGYVVGQPGWPPTGATAWLKLARATVTVPPRGHAVASLALAIPAGTPPGDYLTAVVGSLAGQRAVSAGVSLQPRVALISVVTVLGDLHPGLSCGPLTTTRSGGTEKVSLTVTNTGNTLQTLSGTLTVRGSGATRNVPLTPDGLNVIPGGSLTLTAPVTGLPTLGTLDLDATVTATVNGKSVATTHPNTLNLRFIPWLPIGIGGVALAALVALFFATRGRRKARRARKAEERQIIAAHRAQQHPVQEPRLTD
ncbi:MAG TPA: hypothetical protein VI248_20130 [Kineosporiaceae bacterium]